MNSVRSIRPTAQRAGDLVLLGVAGKHFQQGRGRRGPGLDRGRQPQKLVPGLPDDMGVDDPAEMALERWIGVSTALEAVEAPVLQIPQARRKTLTKQREQTEH